MNTLEQKSGPRDVFMQLLAVIGLYVTVISFGAIVYHFINLYFPDALMLNYGYYGSEGLRWPLSILVIVFPLFVWLNSYLRRDLERNPEKRDLKTRKWAIHFTLFVASIVIAGDLISLIYRFLQGELTTRFILKVLMVLLIAGAVFLYYLWDLRRGTPEAKDSNMRALAWAIVAIVGVTILAGFVVAGSPQAERMRRFDDRRVSDLQNLQYQIVEYWRAKTALPKNLSELRDDIQGIVPPKDPETGADYEYRSTGTRTFELCATFKTENQNGKSPSYAYPAEMYGETWKHKAERTCFSRTIDPDRFPPYEKPRAL